MSMFKRFLSGKAGLAAIEFSFIAPVMILTFFGVVEGSQALSASRRTVLAAATLADLVAQEPSITKAQLDDLFVGVEDVIDDQPITATFTVASIFKDTATNEIKVAWSLDSTGAQPYAANSLYTGTIDATLLDDASSLIIGQASFNYASAISQKIFPAMTLTKSATRWPRRSQRVQYCDAANVCVS